VTGISANFLFRYQNRLRPTSPHRFESLTVEAKKACMAKDAGSLPTIGAILKIRKTEFQN
jgi:hypothetical protein